MEPHRMDRSIGELFADLSHQTAELVHKEMRLAKAELSGKLADAGRHMAIVAAAAAFGLTALITVSAAIVLLLIETGIRAWLSAVIVAALMGGTAFVLAQSGLASLRRKSIAPAETIQSLKETTQWLKTSAR